MSADPELCFEIINLLNHPKILTSQKLCNPLELFDLENFAGRMEPISWLVFNLVKKIKGKSLQKTRSNMENSGTPI